MSSVLLSKAFSNKYQNHLKIKLQLSLLGLLTKLLYAENDSK